MKNHAPSVQSQVSEKENIANLVAPEVPDHELLRCIGHGGYGQVWLAKNVMGTFRAVKVVYRRSFTNDNPYEREFAGIKRFEPISRTHPGLMSILHVGRHSQECYYYYVMEIGDDIASGQNIAPESYVPKTLKSELVERGRLPAAECLRLGLSLSGALGYLHSHGLVHRDVKPSNIIFVSREPKLADIGLVTDIGEAATAVGTEGYIPPEGPGSPIADLYSLGKVLYEISTGLDRTQFPSLPTRLREYPDAPLLAGLNLIILKACDPDPRKRFSSSEELHTALRKLEGGEAGSAGTGGFMSRPHDASVAVLPFLNMCADRENEYLSDGITEDLTTTLAQVKGLRVAGRTSAFAFKGKPKDIRKIAELLGVSTVVEGSVRKAGKRLRITAQLIKASDGCYLWSERYDREMKDVFALQDEISRAIVAALKLRLVGDTNVSFVKGKPASTEAYQLYLQGCFHWNQRGEGLKKAMHYFELALLEDPAYAQACAGLADSYNLLGFYGYFPPREVIPKAKALAVKAVEADETLAEAHVSLGFSQLIYDWDWRAALKEFERALQINPHYSPAYYWTASYLSAVGRHEEAVALDLRALEIDPLSVFVRAHLGWTYLHARQFNRAEQQLSRTLEIDPGFVIAHWVLGRTHLAQSRYDEAIREFEQLLHSPPFNTWGLAGLGQAYAVLGQPERAAKLLTELEQLGRESYVRAYLRAEAHLALGQFDQTFACLQKSYEERDVWLGWIRCDPAFDGIQTDPRFGRLWQSLGLD